MEYSHCGVGFITSLKNEATHQTLKLGLRGLKNVEHRGGSADNGRYGDGAGVMTSIPYELLGIDEKEAVAMMFAPADKDQCERALKIFEKTFKQFGLKVSSYRDVPVRADVLGLKAQKTLPRIIQAFIDRPHHCRTMSSFDELLYSAKQKVRTRGRDKGIEGELYFTSLSSRTIIYKALCTSAQLEEFYPDLTNPIYRTTFALFHRRFSTNTMPSWDKVQPFRMIAHNGEINTIEGNRTAAKSRELALGLKQDQILTGQGASDSGNLNDMVEALKYRSSMPFLKDILAIMIPPAQSEASSYFKFWSRAMEPWDGPALIAYCDGKKIGARLDRSGFRPCRWQQDKDYFTLCSEAGSFELLSENIIQQGVLNAGKTVNIHIYKGSIDFLNPDKLENNEDVFFDSRLRHLAYRPPTDKRSIHKDKLGVFYFTVEDLKKELYPMIEDGKEPIGSMGDTATLAAMSTIHRSIYDYFYQDFAQVTNPPLDYIREKMVTSLKTYLGRKPNIFSPKEMIPPPAAIELDSPVMSLGQMEEITNQPNSITIDICFNRSHNIEGFMGKIDECVDKAIDGTRNGNNIIILSDRNACYETPAIPSIIVMRAVQLKLNKLGIRLKVSLIVDTGEIRNGHQIAVLISFGASAVCPYIALDIARYSDEVKGVDYLDADQKEQRLLKAFSESVLKIMAKRGISVVRSYQGSELFTIMGLDKDILDKLFKSHELTLGGLSFNKLLEEILARTEQTKDGNLVNNFVYKEHATGKFGESHSLTTKKTKLIHNLLKQEYQGVESEQWQNIKREIYNNPVNIRDLLSFKSSSYKSQNYQKREDILKLFGSGAMSYGSISAETQRDIFLAMNKVEGRSNSGEGGENPFFYSDGITSKIKQIASGRFGVTAEYLMRSNEIQIKMAQGAKPGEGGQLMGVKVDESIAKARFSTKGVSLISPPPHHDIYSIEDLKELIYELKQLKPDVKVSVKLVSGKNIGAIAMGVVKAGADIILISGGCGGTGAATLMSMKHAGLPWEIGLMEVHKQLSDAGLRHRVVLRVDGGLYTGRDIITAAILGAQEFDFGKILLVTQGCIMARVCEKNTCPTGIATQDPKFKARYTGLVDEIVKYLTYVADDVIYYLKKMGVDSLSQLIGQTELLEPSMETEDLRRELNLNLDFFLKKHPALLVSDTTVYEQEKISTLNNTILENYKKTRDEVYLIRSTDRAIPASLYGHRSTQKNTTAEKLRDMKLEFKGSAGQGFGVFNTDGVSLLLRGEANDSVAKGMSGGEISIFPTTLSKLSGESNVIIGNTCLYGATGGRLYVNGKAGDRFAVRNSGAVAIVEGVGLHACEYMTGGVVVILGSTLQNIGAGMTGGVIYCHKDNIVNINQDFLSYDNLTSNDLEDLGDIYSKYTTKLKAHALYFTDRSVLFKKDFIKLVPKN